MGHLPSCTNIVSRRSECSCASEQPRPISPPTGAAGNATDGPVVMLGNRNSLVRSEESVLTTVVGLDDVVVITTADAAATDAGLVGDDDDRPAQLLNPETRQVEDAENELELVDEL